MDPAALFSELIKLGPFVALMGVIVYVLYRRNKDLEEKNDKLQEDKLGLTKAIGDITNISNRHIESSNELLKTMPQAFAAAIVASQDKIISEIREAIKGVK